VATGSLDVDLPVEGQSEVSYLTQVFNHMVASLRQGREELSTANEALTKTNEELQQLSITDGLTGLYNRKHIMELFEQELVRARRYHQKLTILMLDIDHFKTINDTYGHQTGDAVLHRLAKSLRELIRDCDHIGRYGGEEFLIILPESDKLDGAKAAERIRHQVSTFDIDAGMDNLPITISVGVSGYPADGQDINTLLSYADEALYKSKTDGRDKVTIAGGLDPADGPKLKVIN
jgi:diguanylate cyclase (GGDEF)-like protein